MSNFTLSAFADEIADDLETQMDVLEQHEINYIEIRGVYGKPLVQYSLKEVRDIKKKLDKRGFKISAVGSPIGKIYITDDFEPHRELFRHTIKIAHILETQYIRMFSFYIPKGANPQDYRSDVIKRWRELIKEAKGSGLILLHENEKDIYGDTPERCLDLINALDCSYVKAVFDPANFVQCEVKTYPEAYELIKDNIVYMHIKDALYGDHSVVPAGYGDGKIKDILKSLKNREYKGFLSLEPHLGSFTGLAALEHNSKITGHAMDGPGKFAIASKALKDMLHELNMA